MAFKGSEEYTANDSEFDQEAILKENLSDLPEKQEITGLWQFVWISANVKSGHSDKGPWAMINIQLDPVAPAGENATEVEYDADDMPRIFHRMFYTKVEDRRRFVALARAFGVAPGQLNTMLEELRGTTAIAKATKGTDNFGRPETKLGAFRPVDTQLRVVA